MAKRCPKCATEKPREAFSKLSSRPDGLQVYCRACRNAHHAANKASINARQSARYLAAMSDPAARDRRRAKGRDYMRAWTREKQEADPAWAEQHRNRKRRWYDKAMESAEYRAARVAAAKAWREREVAAGRGAHLREQFRAGMERWRTTTENRAKGVARTRDWRHTPRGKEVTRDDRHRRRARLAQVPSVSSPALRAEVLASANGRCAYCGSTGMKLTLDHIIAISRGGHDVPENWAAACFGCNTSKGAKDLAHWARSKFGPEALDRLTHLTERAA